MLSRVRQQKKELLMTGNKTRVEILVALVLDLCFAFESPSVLPGVEVAQAPPLWLPPPVAPPCPKNGNQEPEDQVVGLT